MNKKVMIGGAIFIVALVVILSVSLSGNKGGANPTANVIKNTNSNSNSQSGTFPVSSGSAGFKITNALVENNVDPSTGQAVPDHLELTLQNTAGKDISNFVVYYSIFDRQANKKETYSQNLTGFVLPAGKSETIHFDGGQGSNHFWVNKYSIYYTSYDSLDFNVVVDAPGYQGQTVQVTKAAGGAEVPNQ